MRLLCAFTVPVNKYIIECNMRDNAEWGMGETVMKTSMSLIYTNDNCIGCNRCISVCSSNGACTAVEENGKHRIKVDPNRCVGCGACLDVCEHRAREYYDDTERFFEDLKAGKNISVLVAPAFKANYPDEYNAVLGYIHKMGAKRFINVSFGADITTWGYLNYIIKNDIKGGISQPCPAVVAYIERHIPELIGNLIPIQSPLMCAAIYARKYMHIEDEFAFISPCIAKKLEICDPVNEGRVSYNVTFKHLMQYIENHPMEAEPYDDELEYGLGSAYSMPGGLKENIHWFMGEDVFVRQMDGEKRMYRYLENNKDILLSEDVPFVLVDALNCSNGCIYGTACDSEKYDDDRVLFNQIKIKNSVKRSQDNTPWDSKLSCNERFEKLNERFKDLNINDYMRSYEDKSSDCVYVTPTEEERDAIFNSMGKTMPEERKINCAMCGYDSCTQMANAIFNGFNSKENCVNYLRYEVLEQEKQSAAAAAASDAKSTFLANMSHEIRTPLNGVLGMNNMILQESNEPQVIKYARDIETAGRGLLTIINDILDLSKVESGKITFNCDNYSLISLIDDCHTINSNFALRKGLYSEIKFAKPVPRNLYGDEARVRQVIMNLMSNAIKYTEKGGVTVTLDWEARDEGNALISVCVSDTGQGISAEDLPGVFDPFKRMNEKRNTYIPGTGLGLPISKQLAELMGGTITVQSVEGEGSKFTATFVQKLVGTDTVGSITQDEDMNLDKTEKTQEFTSANSAILAVDDTPINLKVVKGLLKQTLINVDTADSGFIALEMLRNKKYDLILMDHMMPDMDGVETLHRLRKETDNPNIDTPVFVLTANAMRGACEEYMAQGFADYISKPVIPGELIAKIRTILEK